MLAKLSYILTRSVISISLLLLLSIVQSCGVYNFTGGAIPPEIKSISIGTIYNETGLGPTNMSQNMTEKLKQYYLSNSKLAIVPSGGDWQLEGKITGFISTGVAPSANETAGGNRLTITARVSFVNTKDEKQNFDSDFSFFKDYSKDQSLNQVENTLTDAILDQIVLDIFQKTTSNW
jgi:hypothetical protein